MWETRSILTEMGWTVIVLIPKERKDTRGIGSQELVWELLEAVIGTKIKAELKFHDILHGFWAGRGMG